jgi:GH24 family phage-related lysozyme (muramidase)
VLDTITYLPKLKEFEGVYSYMYLDTTGNVTVGVGNLLPSAAAAQKLAFVLRPNPLASPPILTRPATLDEIAADFDSIDNQPPGKLAGYYKQFTRLDLPGNVIDALLGSRVQEFTAALCTAFPDFNSYPAEACAAIFDMAFNMGLGKLTSAFPSFCKAVKRMDWATAAAQCRRIGINNARNDWTKAQLEKACANSKLNPIPAKVLD